MHLSIFYVTPRSTSAIQADVLITQFLNRIPERFAITETQPLRNTDALLEHLHSRKQRTSPLVVLLDSRGKQFSSEQFAQWLGKQRDEGRQNIVFAIGPADGWSDETRKRADLLLSLGPMTLPHELARVVLSEQIYRAFTILSGHPYHTGH